MPGNSPGEAVERFLAPIKQAIQCVGSGHLHYRDNPHLDQLESATLNAGEGLKAEAAGPHAPSITIGVELTFIPIYCPDDELRGPYRCRSAGYILTLDDSDGREMAAFHWHPIQTLSREVKPHFHIGDTRIQQLERLHVPTPRVTVEQFVALSIESFGVVPLVNTETWQRLLTQSREVHEEYRSWGERDEAPPPEDLAPPDSN